MERCLRAVRLNYELALVNDLKHAPKKFFAYAQQRTILRSESSKVLKQDGYLSDGALKSATIFSSYFAPVFRPGDRCPCPPILI